MAGEIVAMGKEGWRRTEDGRQAAVRLPWVTSLQWETDGRGRAERDGWPVVSSSRWRSLQ
jgi:hypothetical protein